MTPCAFFEEGNCIESMEAHIKKGLELIEKMYLKRNYGVLLGRILGIEPEVAGDILRKAYVLHDIGKCLEKLQKRGASFGFHWFYSYLVARNVLSKFGDSGKIAAVAILLHHHDWVISQTPKKPENLRLCEKCIHLIEDIIGEKVSVSIPWDEPQSVYSEVENLFRINKKNIRGVYAFLLPIVVADNYAAAINRGGRRSALVEEILEVLRLRGWSLACGFPGGVR